MKEKTITNPNGRIICIGDLHGCFEEAVELLDLCKITKDDKVIFVGDLVDRGPDNDKCVDLAMQHECVLGNHEETHLRYRKLEEEGKIPQISSRSHIETREQLRPEHYEYFKTLPLYIRLPEHNAVVAHAGAFPNVPMEAQDQRHLLHIQMINPPDKATKWASKAPSHWIFWTNKWKGPEKVIFGHSVLDRPLITEFAVGIDGGAVFGHKLWAYELPSGKIYEVQGKNTNHTRDRVMTYSVHGDVKTYS